MDRQYNVVKHKVDGKALKCSVIAVHSRYIGIKGTIPSGSNISISIVYSHEISGVSIIRASLPGR
jgi:hypothetical protein